MLLGNRTKQKHFMSFESSYIHVTHLGIPRWEMGVSPIDGGVILLFHQFHQPINVLSNISGEKSSKV